MSESRKPPRIPLLPADPAPVRKRGRPPASPEAQASIRQRLLEATGTVFARVGYHGLSVELILAEAGLSRPTYYKHFRNSDEPIRILIQQVNDRLIERILAAAGGSGDPFTAVEAGLTAWRDWGAELGPMLRPLFAELHDPHSPASAHRRRTLTLLGEQLRELIQRFGRPCPTRLQVDALLHGVEYLGYRFHLDTPGGDAHWKQARDAMLRLAIALLGGPGEWEHAAQLAQHLGIELAPVELAVASDN